MKKVVKICMQVFTLCGLLMLLTACKGAVSLDNDKKASDTATQAPASQVKDPKDIKVGLSISTLSNPFFVTVQEGIEEVAKEKGSQLVVLDAQDNTETQINNVNDLLQQDIDVLLINPVDASAITPAVEAANAKSVPVILIDRSSDGGEVVTLVSSDNVRGGEMAAEYLIDKLGEGAKVVQLEGIPGSSSARERGEGFTKAANGKLEVVDSQPANFDRAEGLSVMENILQGHRDIQAVFCQNDEMALGAIEALKGAGLLDKVLVVGFDGTDEGLKAVNAGEMALTIAQQPKEMGKIAMKSALDYLSGKQLEAHIDSPLEAVEAK